MKLDRLERGITARITGIDWDQLAPDEGKRLRALGLDHGAEVSVMHRGVFGGGDPLAVQVGSMTVALRRIHAAAMTVEAM
jgi:ferrous iron transport protein A